MDSALYGVPVDLDLTHFHAASCIQVAIGEHQIQFHFHPSASVSVEGRWELRDGDGQVIDQSMEHIERPTYQIHRIVSQAVVDTFVKAPTSFGLVFNNNLTLEVFDDSTQYESCTISPTGVII